MHRAVWRIPAAGIAVASLALVGGTTFGGELGSVAAGYGVLVGLAAAYALVGLAVRERAWRRLSRVRNSTQIGEVAGHRVF